MAAKEESKNPKSRNLPAAPAARKRFRLERLEERIAPSKGGKGTHNCSFGDSSNTAESSGGNSAY
jgi:hypothetical protein